MEIAMGNGIMARERQAGRKPTSRRTNLGRQSRHEKAQAGKSQKIFRTNVGLSTRLNIRVMQADGFMLPATRHIGHQLN